MAADSRLQVVGEETAPDPFPVTEKKPLGSKIATDAIALALTALSQRAVIALANLFVLLATSSVFVLWYVTPDPNVYQLVKLLMYGLFVLGISWIVRRR
jgi:hypothetical protein